MGADNETKEKLIASAKSEFMEKGYAKASLRKICANAGVTTGALYFFFKDKEDLFRSIVERPLHELFEILKNHFTEDSELMNVVDVYVHKDGDHDAIVQILIHHLYINRDAFLLLLTNAQGTAFENFMDDIVEIIEHEYMINAKNMAKQTSGMQINSYMMHWMTHISIDAFVHLLTHESDEKRALQHMSIIMDYLVSGWVKMILIPEDTRTN